MLSPLAPHFASELWAAFVDNAPKKTTDFDWVKLMTVLPNFIFLHTKFSSFYNTDKTCLGAKMAPDRRRLFP